MEYASWVDNKVIELCVTHGAPRERCTRCRWVLTFKDLDKTPEASEWKALSPDLFDGSKRKAKARMVIIGYENAGLVKNATWSPTLRRGSRNLLLRAIVQRRHVLFSLEAKTAFLLGNP